MWQLVGRAMRATLRQGRRPGLLARWLCTRHEPAGQATCEHSSKAGGCARESECASLVRGALGERRGDEGLAGQGHREADDHEQRREHRDDRERHDRQERATSGAAHTTEPPQSLRRALR